MEVNKTSYFSKKITFLNVSLTFIIVVLHAKTPERWGLPLDMNNPFIYLVNIFTQIGVPMFFFVSGLLFYKNCSFKDIERKLNSRIYSLLIPYIIWNVLFVAIFFILTHVPFIHSKMNAGSVLNNPKEIIYSILNARYTVLWFVKDLMIFCISSAGIYIALRNKIVSITILIASIINALLGNYGYESVFMWFPMYFSGAIIGKLYSENLNLYHKIAKTINNKTYKYWILVFFMILYGIAATNPDKSFYFRFFSPIIIWFLVDSLLKSFLERKFQIKPWMSYMFFIFCTHQFVLNILQKLIVLTFPPTPFILNATFIISPLIVILSLIGIARILSKYRFYTYLSGGR